MVNQKTNACPDGVIGSRVRLRSACRKTFRFESELGHILVDSMLLILVCLIFIINNEH